MTSGVFQAYSGSRSQKRRRCRLVSCQWPSNLPYYRLRGIANGKSAREHGRWSYRFSSLSTKPSLAWNKATLFTYCMSPFAKCVLMQNFSPRKCKASRASAWASVIGGISELRGRWPKPTKYLRPYWRDILSGVVSVAA